MALAFSDKTPHKYMPGNVVQPRCLPQLTNINRATFTSRGFRGRQEVCRRFCDSSNYLNNFSYRNRDKSWSNSQWEACDYPIDLLTTIGESPQRRLIEEFCCCLLLWQNSDWNSWKICLILLTWKNSDWKNWKFIFTILSSAIGFTFKYLFKNV